MPTLLVVNSSPRSNSVSRTLTQKFVEDWRKQIPNGKVVERDLSAGLPLLTEEWIMAAYTPEVQRTTEQKQLLSLSDTLIDEVLAADLIVLGIPMHNFSVPAACKAWIDQIARAGKTFSYTDQGPKGLIPSDKKVVAILSRGGAYAPHMASGGADLQETFLRQILSFFGLTDITFVHADRQGMGTEAAQAAAERALQHLVMLVQSCPTSVAA